MSERDFALTQRVYYEHTDHGRVVYHADYLKFFERARTEWLRELGFDQSKLERSDSIVFVVHHMDIHFRKPARFDDLLQVDVHVLNIGRASMDVAQRISRDNVLLCTAEVGVACVAVDSLKPCPIPEILRRKLNHAY